MPCSFLLAGDRLPVWKLPGGYHFFPVVDAAVDKMKTVFELTQYKFLFHQDSNVTGLLGNIFGGVLTPSQIARIPKLDVGENILSIASDRNIEFKVHLPADEEAVFQGGM